jgi:hypothetical protein
MESLDVKIEKQKTLAEHNRTRRIGVLLGGILCGVFLGAVWIVIVPDSSPSPKAKLSVGLALGILAGMLFEKMCLELVYCEMARCPVCGYDWEIKEGKTVPLKDQMLTWDKCPGCETIMNESVRALTRRKSQGLTSHKVGP